MSSLFNRIAWRRACRLPPPYARQAVPCACAFAPRRRAYSAAPACEDVQVQCRSNGSITLNVHHRVAPSDPSRIVILYLPSGRALFSPGPNTHGPGLDLDDFVVQQLLASTQGTVVRINYRAGNGVSYPTPVHDVLAGYDWVVKDLAPSLASSRTTQPQQRHVKLGVCGQLLGGSLATALAVTECRMGSDRVAAAAVNNPIAEWAFSSDVDHANSRHSASQFTSPEALAASASVPRRRTKKPLPTSWELNANSPLLPTDALIAARSTFMQRTSQWFDPFASPTLFFRSSAIGLMLPGELPMTSDQDVKAHGTVQESHPDLGVPVEDSDSYNYDLSMIDHVPEETSLVSGEPTAQHPQPDGNNADGPLVPRRRAHRIYPPQGSALRLPSMRVSTSTSSPLYDQAVDLVKLMRRSVVKTALRSHGHVHPDVELLEGDKAKSDAVRMAEKRIELSIERHAEDDAGLWTLTAESEQQLRHVGSWFRRKLG